MASIIDCFDPGIVKFYFLIEFMAWVAVEAI